MKQKVRHIPGPQTHSMPRNRSGTYVGRESVEGQLREIGISSEVFRFIRLPSKLTAGHKETEFYDIISEQPFPGVPEDLPGYCFEKNLPAPSWIKERYISVDEGMISFIDVPRKVFIRVNVSDQKELVSAIQQAILEAR